MINIETTLVTNCRTRKKQVQIDFEESEWETIEAFHAEVEQLRATRFAQEGQGGSITVSIDRNSGVSSNAKPVDSEALAAMLHRARPFLLQDEPLYFFKILNVLKRRTNHLTAFF